MNTYRIESRGITLLVGKYAELEGFRSNGALVESDSTYRYCPIQSVSDADNAFEDAQCRVMRQSFCYMAVIDADNAEGASVAFRETSDLLSRGSDSDKAYWGGKREYALENSGKGRKFGNLWQREYQNSGSRIGELIDSGFISINQNEPNPYRAECSSGIAYQYALKTEIQSQAHKTAMQTKGARGFIGANFIALDSKALNSTLDTLKMLCGDVMLQSVVAESEAVAEPDSLSQLVRDALWEFCPASKPLTVAEANAAQHAKACEEFREFLYSDVESQKLVSMMLQYQEVSDNCHSELREIDLQSKQYQSMGQDVDFSKTVAELTASRENARFEYRVIFEKMQATCKALFEESAKAKRSGDIAANMRKLRSKVISEAELQARREKTALRVAKHRAAIAAKEASVTLSVKLDKSVGSEQEANETKIAVRQDREATATSLA